MKLPLLHHTYTVPLLLLIRTPPARRRGGQTPKCWHRYLWDWGSFDLCLIGLSLFHNFLQQIGTSCIIKVIKGKKKCSDISNTFFYLSMYKIKTVFNNPQLKLLVIEGDLCLPEPQ